MGSALKFRNSEVPRQTGEAARLRVIRGPEAGVTYVLKGDSCVLGRGENCDVILLDVKSSRRHAEIRRAGPGAWTIRDLGSSNGIVVAGKVTRESRLSSGDAFSVGETAFEFLTAESETRMLLAPPRAAAGSLEEQREFERQRDRVRSLSQAAQGGAPAQADPLAGGGKKANPIVIAAAVLGVAYVGLQTFSDVNTKAKTSSVSTLVDKCVKNYVRQDRLKSRVIEEVEERLRRERERSPFGGEGRKSGAEETTSVLATLTLPQIIDKCVAEVLERKRLEKSAKDAERTARDLAGDSLAGVPPEVARASESLFKQGLREFQNGNFVRARQSFETVLQMVPSHPLARIYINHCTLELESLVSRYLASGKQKMDAGKLREARGQFEAVKRLLNQDQTSPHYIEADEQARMLDKMLRKGSTG